MAERKIDLFGTFLDGLKRQPGPQPSAEIADRIANLRGGPTREPASQADPLNELLKALRDGERTAKDLLPIAGNSITNLITASDRLMELGWVTKLDGDVFALTETGRDVASML